MLSLSLLAATLVASVVSDPLAFARAAARPQPIHDLVPEGVHARFRVGFADAHGPVFRHIRPASRQRDRVAETVHDDADPQTAHPRSRLAKHMDHEAPITAKARHRGTNDEANAGLVHGSLTAARERQAAAHEASSHHDVHSHKGRTPFSEAPTHLPNSQEADEAAPRRKILIHAAYARTGPHFDPAHHRLGHVSGASEPSSKSDVEAAGGRRKLLLHAVSEHDRNRGHGDETAQEHDASSLQRPLTHKQTLDAASKDGGPVRGASVLRDRARLFIHTAHDRASRERLEAARKAAAVLHQVQHEREREGERGREHERERERSAARGKGDHHKRTILKRQLLPSPAAQADRAIQAQAAERAAQSQAQAQAQRQRQLQRQNQTPRPAQTQATQSLAQTQAAQFQSQAQSSSQQQQQQSQQQQQQELEQQERARQPLGNEQVALREFVQNLEPAIRRELLDFLGGAI